MTSGLNALHTWSHCPCCFYIIAIIMPGAVGAAGEPAGVVKSRLIACIQAVEVRSKSTLLRGHRRSTLRWCWYSGAKSWAELLIWACSPPMGLHRTATVQGLNSAHGRGEHRQNCPFFSNLTPSGKEIVTLQTFHSPKMVTLSGPRPVRTDHRNHR